MTRQIITTCTRDCPNTCGLIAHVDNGRVSKLTGNPEHPANRGFACRKCVDFVHRGTSSERILTPLRRQGKGFRPVSWDSALDEIAERMTGIRAEHGPEAILYYRGAGQRTGLKLLCERFFNLFGGVTGLQGSLCGGTGQASQDLDFGTRISHDPLDHANSRHLILWGRNPRVTNPTLARIAREVRARGGHVVLIDPVASESRTLASQFIQPAPGSDAYLALAAAKLILQQGNEDRDFIARHSEGFKAFGTILERFDLEELCRRCDVPVQQVRELAALFSEAQPTAVTLGWGMHRYTHAHLAIRAIDALAAISGNLGIPGGGVSQGFEEYAPFDWDCTGDHLHPERRRLPLPRIGAEILAARNPAIEMIFVTAGNPIGSAPNSALVRKAFKKTPFVVVAGLFLDDTAREADIVLPSTTFMEEDDFVGSYGHNYLGPVNRAVDPPGECRTDFDMFRALSRRFELADPFDLPAEQWLGRLLAPTLSDQITLETLRRGPYRLPAAPMVPYADRRFDTPSGKYRFLTDFDLPETKGDSSCPLHLLSISPPEWLCTEMTPADQQSLAVIRIHPDHAAALGICEGEEVIVENDLAQVRATARLDSDQRRDTVVFPRGKWLESGSGVNLLTRDLVSEVGCGTPYYETRVRLRKI